MQKGAISIEVEVYKKSQFGCRAYFLAIQVAILPLMLQWCWGVYFNDENLRL